MRIIEREREKVFRGKAGCEFCATLYINLHLYLDLERVVLVISQQKLCLLLYKVGAKLSLTF